MASHGGRLLNLTKSAPKLLLALCGMMLIGGCSLRDREKKAAKDAEEGRLVRPATPVRSLNHVTPRSI